MGLLRLAQPKGHVASSDLLLRGQKVDARINRIPRGSDVTFALFFPSNSPRDFGYLDTL
jgi:hypothetical protein